MDPQLERQLVPWILRIRPALHAIGAVLFAVTGVVGVTEGNWVWAGLYFGCALVQFWLIRRTMDANHVYACNGIELRVLRQRLADLEEKLADGEQDHG